MRSKKFLRLFLFGFAIFWLILIFIFSAQNENLSNSVSYGVSDVIVRIVRPDFESLPDGEQAYQLWQVNVVLRKLAHFFLYTILGVLLHFAASCLKWHPRRQFCAALSLGLFFSCLDELHQYFIPGRTALIYDVIIDFAGILLGCVLFGLLKCLRSRIWRRSAAEL